MLVLLIKRQNFAVRVKDETEDGEEEAEGEEVKMMVNEVEKGVQQQQKQQPHIGTTKVAAMSRKTEVRL